MYLKISIFALLCTISISRPTLAMEKPVGEVSQTCNAYPKEAELRRTLREREIDLAYALLLGQELSDHPFLFASKSAIFYAMGHLFSSSALKKQSHFDLVRNEPSSAWGDILAQRIVQCGSEFKEAQEKLANVEWFNTEGQITTAQSSVDEY
jgi:hypothetical protein